jgi:pyruvyltransferase
LKGILQIARSGARPRFADFVTSVDQVDEPSFLTGALRRIARFPDRPIPLYWFSGRPNFGDALSAVVVKYMSNATPVLVSSGRRGKVLAVGSILHRLAEGDIVWGTGAMTETSITPPPRVRFCAVRGPLTRSQIRADVPEIYGDPTMLLPRIYTPNEAKRFSVGIVPHYVEAQAIDVTDSAISVIDVLSDWRSVIDGITECETIISSSLHGLIVAEAYGVPAIWFTSTDRVLGAGFKFRDYYLSTGREPPPPVAWSDSITSMTRRVMDPPTLNLRPLQNAWPRELTF